MPPICQLQCCCTYFCASCAARAQWSVIGARGDGTAAEDPRESDRARHGCLQTSPRAPKRQADRWAQSTVAGCQRPARSLSRGQRSRAAGAYRSGLHVNELRRGVVVLCRLCRLRLARVRSDQSSVRETMEQRRRARAKATACGMAVCRRRHVLRRDRQTDGHRVPSQVASGRRGRFRAGSGRVLRVRTGAVSMMVSRGVVL